MPSCTSPERCATEAGLTETIASFEDHLAREIIHSERMRMAVLAGLLGTLLAFYGLGFALFRKLPILGFLTPGVFFYILAVIALLLCYELAIRYLLGSWLRRGRGVPGALRYLNAFVETSVPSILIILVSRELDPVYVLQSPLGLLYAVFIVLSTLRLDFRLCAFTGLVAAAEYVALSFAYIGVGSSLLGGAARAPASTPFEAPPFYVAKAAILLLAGLAAGFVADQLKRRVSNVFRAREERQRIVSTFGQQVSPAIVDALLGAGTEIVSKRTFVCVCSWTSATSPRWLKRSRRRRSSPSRTSSSPRRSTPSTATTASSTSSLATASWPPSAPRLPPGTTASTHWPRRASWSQGSAGCQKPDGFRRSRSGWACTRAKRSAATSARRCASSIRSPATS
jgi:hypothetical protein